MSTWDLTRGGARTQSQIGGQGCILRILVRVSSSPVLSVAVGVL
jgi:hypothetical protein